MSKEKLKCPFALTCDECDMKKYCKFYIIIKKIKKLYDKS